MLKQFDRDITSLAFMYAHCGAKEENGNRVYAVAAMIIRPGLMPLEFDSLVRYLKFTGRERFYSNLTKQQLSTAPDSTHVSNQLKAFLKDQSFIFSLNGYKDINEIKKFSGVERIIDLNLSAEYFLPDLRSHSFKALWEYLLKKGRDRIHFTVQEMLRLSIELVKHICSVRLNDKQFPRACALRFYLGKSNTLFGSAFFHVSRKYTDYFGGLFGPCSSKDTDDWKKFLKKATPEAKQEQESEPYKKLSVSDLSNRYRTLADLQTGFQYRPSQTEFAGYVAEAINRNSVLCIEAGTGTGKTLGYLVPVMDFLMRNKNARVAISTYTKTLQDQVFEREVAFVKEQFKAYRDIPVCVLKGKSSYLCVRKLDYTLEGGEKGARLLAWLYLINICYYFTKADVDSVGNMVDIYLNDDLFLTHTIRTASAREGCLPSHKTCPAQVVTAQARDARLIITNHHKLALLERDSILSGLFRNYVIDEANHFEHAVRNAWKEEIDSRDVSLSLDYLKKAFGKILFRASRENRKIIVGLLSAIETVDSALGSLRYALGSVNPTSQPGEEKSLPFSDSRFKEGHIRNHLKEIQSAISKVHDDLKSVLNEDRCRILKIVSRTIAKIANERSLIQFFAESIMLFEKSIAAKNKVVSFRVFKNHFVLSAATVEVGNVIRDHVYKNRDWVVYTAATLRYKNSFDCFKRIVGLERPLIFDEQADSAPKDIFLRDIPSPFPAAAMEIVVPGDAIAGKFEYKKLWLDYVVRVIPNLIKENKGRTLVLFSSYSDLAYVSERVSDDIAETMYPLLVQEPGQPTINLGESFLAVKESVLFGVDTFWYGVDFKGDTLTQVIITRIPYPAPIDPVQMARKNMMTPSEYWERYHYDMSTKLRQGIGRLIRSHTDRGKVVILDSRFATQEHEEKYISLGETANELCDKRTAGHEYANSISSPSLFTTTEDSAIFDENVLDLSGIQNANGTYKDGPIKKIDVLKRFISTDIKEKLTDLCIRFYIEEISKIKKSPSLTLVVRVLRGSKSKRVSEDMKKLPFWGCLSHEIYPGLTAAHIKPFVYPFLIILGQEKGQEVQVSNSMLTKKQEIKTDLLHDHLKKNHPLSITPADFRSDIPVEDQWEPPDVSTKDFALNQIKKLGSIEALDEFYSRGSSIDGYARKKGKRDYSPEFASTSALARDLGVKGEDLFGFLSSNGYLKKDKGQWQLTERGYNLGGEYGSVGGPAKFPVWPRKLLKTNLFEQLTMKGISLDGGITQQPKNTVNADEGLTYVEESYDFDDNVEETAWEPDDRVKEFISSKILELGSIDAVETYYSRDSAVCLYARQIAPKILATISKETERPDNYFERIRKKHFKAYDSWTDFDDEHLRKELKTGKKISELSILFGRTPGAIRSRIKKLRLFVEGDQRSDGQNIDIIKTAQSDNQLKERRRIICLAASRKYSGYCIAGKVVSEDRSSEWVRPVSKRENGELSNEEIKILNGKTPKLLDVIDISVKKHFPHYYQTENYLNDSSKTWAKVDRVSFSDLSGLCDDVDGLWINGHHSSRGYNDRVPLEKANYELESSLLLIRPRNFKILVRYEQKKMKIRAKFDFEKMNYILAITDPLIEEKFNKKPQGIYQLKSIEVYLCVSLGEPFGGYCYKLVAGIIYNP